MTRQKTPLLNRSLIRIEWLNRRCKLNLTSVRFNRRWPGYKIWFWNKVSKICQWLGVSPLSIRSCYNRYVNYRSKMLWYHLFLVQIDRRGSLIDVCQQSGASGLLIWAHFLNQAVAFTLRIVDYKVTRNFLAKANSVIALDFVLEHYEVVTGFARRLNFDVNFVSSTSWDS